MKRLLSLSKTLLATAALTILVTSAVHAQGGINLSWSDCGAAGTLQQNFACNTNSGVPHILIASAIPPIPIPAMVAMAGVVDIQTNQAALSPWWNFDPTSSNPASTGCRSGPPSSLSVSFDFTGGPFTCNDAWGGGASGGSDYHSQQGNVANRSRLRVVCAVPAPIAVDNVTENYYFKATINNAKTTGTGACAGCTDGACIVFNSIELDQNPGVPNAVNIVTNPLLHNYVLWQGGGGSVAGGCPQAVPTKNATWGSVKSLYR